MTDLEEALEEDGKEAVSGAGTIAAFPSGATAATVSQSSTGNVLSEIQSELEYRWLHPRPVHVS